MQKVVGAFTLIELLIAVSIIAILAAIAVPNFLEAQTRAKCSRAKADLAAIRTALESYAVDENVYPIGSGGLGFTGNLINLIAPREYLSKVPRDTFRDGAMYFYASLGRDHGTPTNPYGAYVIASVGPNRLQETSLTSSINYDPTNGTLSAGDIVVSQSGKSPDLEE